MFKTGGQVWKISPIPSWLKILKHWKKYGTDGRISAASRLSDLQFDVTRKKYFILFPQKIIKFVGDILLDVKHFCSTLEEKQLWSCVENVLEYLGFSYFIRKCNVDEYKRWAIDLIIIGQSFVVYRSQDQTVWLV